MPMSPMLLPDEGSGVRVAKLGQSVRLNKTVAKMDLSKLRSSCQLNYPESASRYRVAPTVGGAPIEKKPEGARHVDHMRPNVPDQLSTDKIATSVAESFIGNHTRLWSDWSATHDPHGRSASPTRRGAMAAKGGSPARKGRRRKPGSPSRRGGRDGGGASPPPHSRHSRTDGVEVLAVQQARAERKAQEKVLVGGMIMRRTELLQLKRGSAFSVADLRRLLAAFKAHADVQDCSAVSPGHFAEVMEVIFDRIEPEVMSRLFHIFDGDGSGTVDCREIVMGCASMVSGEGTVDKFKLLFEAYDTDGSGTISAKEFMRIAHERGGHLDNNLSLVRNVLESLDADADGNVSFAEFRQAAAEMPLLLEAFHDLLPHAVLLEKHVADINASAGGPMDWQRLASMSKFLKQRGVAGQLDRGTFRALMHDFFGFDDPLLTTSMFDAIDRDGSGTVDFKELLGGLSAALRAPTPELKMDFYFSLYDQDQSGVIDRAEVFRLLERGAHHSSRELDPHQAHSMLVKHGLGDLDMDGDGRISHDDFMKAAGKDVELLHVFGQCL